MTENVIAILRRGLFTCGAASLLCLPLSLGCSKAPEPEKTEADAEQERQEYGNQMLEESRSAFQN